MTSFIAAGGSGRSTNVIPAVPAASSVTTIALMRTVSSVICLGGSRTNADDRLPADPLGSRADHAASGVTHQTSALARRHRIRSRSLAHGAFGPMLGPVIDRRERAEQAVPLLGKAIASGGVGGDDAGIPQLTQTVVGHAGGDTAAPCLQLAERWGAGMAQLPQNTERPAPSQQVEQRHRRSPGSRSTYPPSGQRARLACFGIRSYHVSLLCFPKRKDNR